MYDKTPFPARRLLCSALFAAILAGPAQAKRVGLLIGNTQYSVGHLASPPRDVREMEAALKAVGFDDVETIFDADQTSMKRAIRDFGNRTDGAEFAFLYFSGHGIQANGENYLIPVNANIKNADDYEFEAVSASDMMSQITSSRPKATIVVLDACPDNTAAFPRRRPRGRMHMDEPTNTLVALSNAPDCAALERGHYAQALARQIRTPGLELVQVFRRIMDEVRSLSGGRQQPRIDVSLPEPVYFSPQQVAGPATTPTPMAIPSTK
jgi:uncharacterized caspase-like protein